jgi:hypothetical protein
MSVFKVPPKKPQAKEDKPKIAILVKDGYVYEHDVDEEGNRIGPLRPHYNKGEVGYPKGGYPEAP